ncbi:aldose 1-epimerase family protein [Flavisphingomonas formosensis]|uniref:aldose 1-epimerase family protein n=1 Tax=Flavisphingomonas formosensis TaxID=861534 RepID=UPI0012FC8AFF|nr:aldose 1-epimerase family protein [Sphingomonas formosensis]
MDTIEIRSAALSATISPGGAELQSLRDAAGRDFLWGGDPAFWTGRAPILFPIVGALANDSYQLGSHRFSLPRHGFARRSRFAPVVQQDGEAVFRLTDSPPTRAAYPFPFVLEIRFATDDATLSIEATLTNPGDAPLPASFGFHPALRWPLPYGAPRAEHVLLFDKAEPEPVRRLDEAGLLRPVALPSPIERRTLKLDDGLFTDDALILDRLHSRSLWYGVPGTPGVAVRFPDMPALGLWMKPGADYLCIEPWQGHADPEGFAGDFREKPGVVAIPPQQSRRFAMSITVGVDAPA